MAPQRCEQAQYPTNASKEANALAGTSIWDLLANSDKSAYEVVIGRDNR